MLLFSQPKMACEVRDAFGLDIQSFLEDMLTISTCTFATFRQRWKESGLVACHHVKFPKKEHITRHLLHSALERLLMTMVIPPHDVRISLLLIFILYTIHQTQLEPYIIPIEICPGR